MDESDIRYVVQVTDLDWEARQVVERLLELEESKNLGKAAHSVEELFAALKIAVIHRYIVLVDSMKANINTETREERIKLQGGL